MTTNAIPSKTREIHSHHFDSTIWNDFRFRDDDIVIATYAKSGTTWMQQMVAQMRQMGAQVPPEMKPAFDLILKRAGERLQALPGEKK